MFGYVRPNWAAMSEAEQQRYRAHYCGLCRALGKRHGALARMALTFDLTFLAVFLSSLYEPQEQTGQSRCAPHPVKEHPWAASEITDYAADMTIALTYHKCRDDWQDDRSIPAKAYGGILKRHYDEVSTRWPAQCEAIEAALAEQSAIERRKEATLDAAPNCFGRLMAALFVMKQDYWSAALARFGYSLGRYIYMVDAVCDAEKDRKSGSYNPVLLMEKEPEELRDTLEMLLGDASAAFESLPLVQDEGILRNVLYSGLWQGYNEYLEKRRKKRGEYAPDETVKEVDGHGE